MSIPSPSFYVSLSWDPRVAYTTGQIVVYNQKIYQANANSGPTLTPPPTSSWTFISNYLPNLISPSLQSTFANWRDQTNMLAEASAGIESRVVANENVGYYRFAGAWTSSQIYKKGDVVIYGIFGNLLSANVDHQDSTFNGAHWNTAVDLTGAKKKYQIMTSSFTAAKGNSYFLDSTSGNMVVTLPVSPVLGDDPINITHIDGDVTVSGHYITFPYAGIPIMGNAADLTIDKNFSSFSIVYSDATRGFRLTIL